MPEQQTTADYLRDTIDVSKQIETRYVELAARLYKIRTKEMWWGSYENWEEFLDAARIRPSVASILCSIHKHYVVDGGKKTEQLAGIGYSNLYEAIPLIEKEGVDSALVKADTLSRSEIKDEVRDQKHGEHEHTPGAERFAPCETCGKFIPV